MIFFFLNELMICIYLFQYSPLQNYWNTAFIEAIR